jgi:predicted GH43/DUF377 family glycosyl hydrolase
MFFFSTLTLSSLQEVSMIQYDRDSANPIFAPNPDIAWQTGGMLNPHLIEDPDSSSSVLHALIRCCNGDDFAVPGYQSVIVHAESEDGVTFSVDETPFLTPTIQYESHGCEDAKTSFIENRLLITYTATQSPTDFSSPERAFETKLDQLSVAELPNGFGGEVNKLGVIGMRNKRTKAAIFLPERINGKYHMLYTGNADSPHSYVGLASSTELEDFLIPRAMQLGRIKHNIVIPPRKGARRGPELGGVAKTDLGYLAVVSPSDVEPTPVWSIGDVLLDPDDPSRVLNWARNRLRPKEPYETGGKYNKIVMASSVIIRDAAMLVHYGGADFYGCLARASVDEVIREHTRKFLKKSNVEEGF